MSDPKRLLDELDGGDLRSLLEAGKSETPDDRQLVMLAAKIGIAGIGAAGAGGVGGAGAAGAAGGGAGAGAGGGAGAGAGAAGAGVAGAGTKAAVGAAAVKTGLAIKIVGAVAVVSAVGAGTTVVVKKATAPVETAPVGLVAQASSSATPLGPRADTRRIPRTPPTSEDDGTSIIDPSAASAAPQTSARVATKAPAPSASAEEGPDELKLLESAQDALRSNPSKALALCSDHARRFPHGSFVQERESIAIEALARSGRKPEARARFERFKNAFPGSSHKPKLEALVAD
jgi:hypothetical protein